MTCPKCGANVPDNAKFCESCGAALSENNNYYYTSNTQEESEPVYTAGSYRPGIKKKELVLWIILSFCTCGIGSFIWLITMVNDLNKASRRENDASGIVVWLLGLVTCGLYWIWWFYKAAEKVNYIKKMNGESTDSNLGIIYALLGYFISIVAVVLIQLELNKVAD